MSQRNVLGICFSANTLPRLTKFNSSLNFTAEQVSGCLQVGSRGCMAGGSDEKMIRKLRRIMDMLEVLNLVIGSHVCTYIYWSPPKKYSFIRDSILQYQPFAMAQIMIPRGANVICWQGRKSHTQGWGRKTDGKGTLKTSLNFIPAPDILPHENNKVYYFKRQLLGFYYL